jgi:hypothetical protein
MVSSPLETSFEVKPAEKLLQFHPKARISSPPFGTQKWERLRTSEHIFQ